MHKEIEADLFTLFNILKQLKKICLANGLKIPR